MAKKRTTNIIRLNKFLNKHGFTIGSLDPDPEEWCAHTAIYDIRQDEKDSRAVVPFLVPDSITLVIEYQHGIRGMRATLKLCQERTETYCGHCGVCGQPRMVIYEQSDYYEVQCGCGDTAIYRHPPRPNVSEQQKPLPF